MKHSELTPSDTYVDRPFVYGSLPSGSVYGVGANDGLGWILFVRPHPETFGLPQLPYHVRRAVSAEAVDPDADTAEHAIAREMVQLTRESLSLTITEIATIVGVERATIYGWLAGKRNWPRQASVAAKLTGLYKIAAAWQSRAQGTPLGDLRHFPIGTGPSLLEILRTSRDEDAGLDESKAEAAMRQLAIRWSTQMEKARAALALTSAGAAPAEIEKNRRFDRFVRRRVR